MKLILSLVAFTIPVSVFAAVDQKLDPIHVGGKMYSLKAEDENMRMMEVSFAPGQKIGMHEHPKHYVYVVQGGKLRIHEEGKEPQTMDLVAGQTLVMDAQKHEGQNMGKTKIKLLVTELKTK